MIEGEKWSRAGLAFGAALSVTGNVAHTVLAASTIALGLRVPFAVVWPLALFIAVEILVRVPWRNRMIDWFGRIVLIIPVSIVAAVVSYQHLHQLMQLAGEDGFSSLIGPLAIDGLMLGGTVALLAIRAVRMLTQKTEPPDRIEIDYPLTGDVPLSSGAVDRLNALPDFSGTLSGVFDSGRPIERKPRATTAEQEKAVRMILDGQTVAEVVEATGVSRPTVGRYQTVRNILRNNPQADVADKKVPTALVAIIRDAMNRERAL